MAAADDAAKELAGRIEQLQSPDWHPQTNDALAWLAKWIMDYGSCWSTVDVTAVGVRPKDEWLLMAVKLELSDEVEKLDARLATGELAIVRHRCAVTELPPLIHGVMRGELEISTIGDDGLPHSFLLKPAVSPANASASEYEAQRFDRFSRTRLAQGRYLKLEWSGNGVLQRIHAEVDPKGRWFDEADRRFQALGHGKIGEVAMEWGLFDQSHTLRNGGSFLAQLVVPVPIRILRIEQSADRRLLHVTTWVGPRIDMNGVELMQQLPTWRANERKVVVLPAGEYTSSFAVMPGPDSQDVKLLVTYRQHVVIEQEFKLYPSFATNPRLAAIRAVEGETQLFEPGLRYKKHFEWGGAAMSFERACAQLLGILGFHVSWWGPNNNSEKSKVSQPQAKTALDLLAIAPDDATCLVVECTIESPSPEKVSKLVGRANRIRASLAASLSGAAPVVSPVLAVPVPVDDLTDVVRKRMEEEGVVAITHELIVTVMELLERGAASDELAECLPGALAAGLHPFTPDGSGSRGWLI